MRSFKSIFNHSFHGRKQQQPQFDPSPLGASTHEDSIFAPNTTAQQPFIYHDANTCSLCQAITIKNSVKGCQHHSSWTSLKEGAARGCNLCRLFYDALMYRSRIAGSFHSDIRLIKVYSASQITLVWKLWEPLPICTTEQSLRLTFQYLLRPRNYSCTLNKRKAKARPLLRCLVSCTQTSYNEFLTRSTLRLRILPQTSALCPSIILSSEF